MMIRLTPYRAVDPERRVLLVRTSRGIVRVPVTTCEMVAILRRWGRAPRPSMKRRVRS